MSVMMLTGMYLYVCRSCVMRMYLCNMSSDTPFGVLVFHTGVSRHTASFHFRVSYDLKSKHAVMDTHVFRCRK